MKKSKFSEKQMVAILREADATNADEATKDHGISKQTVYAWRKKLRAMDFDDVLRLSGLESGNVKLKKMRADRMLGIEILKEVNEKKWRAPERVAAGELRVEAWAVLATLLRTVQRFQVDAAVREPARPK